MCDVLDLDDLHNVFVNKIDSGVDNLDSFNRGLLKSSTELPEFYYCK